MGVVGAKDEFSVSLFKAQRTLALIVIGQNVLITHRTKARGGRSEKGVKRREGGESTARKNKELNWGR